MNNPTPDVRFFSGIAALVFLLRPDRREIRSEPRAKSRRPGRRYKARQERVAASGTVRP